MKLAAPAFCLALIYDDETFDAMLPPILALGLESERQAWHAAKAKKKNIETLWDGQRFRLFDDDALDWDEADPILEDADAIAHHLRERSSLEPAHKVLIAVAKKLNAFDWKKTLPVTHDFVVYPVDMEVADLTKNMQASIPAAKHKALRSRGEF